VVCDNNVAPGPGFIHQCARNRGHTTQVLRESDGQKAQRSSHRAKCVRCVCGSIAATLTSRQLHRVRRRLLNTLLLLRFGTAIINAWRPVYTHSRCLLRRCRNLCTAPPGTLSDRGLTSASLRRRGWSRLHFLGFAGTHGKCSRLSEGCFTDHHCATSSPALQLRPRLGYNQYVSLTSTLLWLRTSHSPSLAHPRHPLRRMVLTEGGLSVKAARAATREW
jgi:hypothetical protein